MSMKRLNLNELASLLDETIQKGGELEQKDIIKSKKERETLRKGLSFDPYQPVVMSPDNEFEYHNPYKYDYNEGAFMPHHPDYWYGQGKKPDQDEYNTVKQFYGEKIVQAQQSINRFADLKRSIDSDLFKGGVPVGTVHTYKDGQKYKKIAEGRWSPVAANKYEGGEKTTDMHYRLMGQDEKDKTNASALLDYHASQSTKIKEVLDQKMKEQETMHTAKETAVNHVHEALKFIHGKDMPKDMKHKINQFSEKTSSEDPKEKVMSKIEESIKTKPHKVKLDITINGKKYSRDYDSIHGKDEEDVKNTIQEQLKKVAPTARIDNIKVSGSDVKGTDQAQEQK